MADDPPKIQKGAPMAGDAYFKSNHPEPRIYVVDRNEAIRAMAARFEQYRATLNAPKPPRRKP